MKVTFAAAVATALAFISGAVAGPLERRATAATVVEDLEKLSDLASAVQTETNSINISNAAYRGPSVAQGLSDITVAASNTLADVLAPPTEPFSAEDSEAVVNAFTKFADIHKGVLESVIKKKPILSQFFLTAPVASALRQSEASIDELLLGLLPQLTQSDTEEATTQIESLDEAIRNAERAYY